MSYDRQYDPIPLGPDHALSPRSETGRGAPPPLASRRATDVLARLASANATSSRKPRTRVAFALKSAWGSAF